MPAPAAAASSALTTLDPRTPPIALLRIIGPDSERTADAATTALPPSASIHEALAYCRGLATSRYENFSVLSHLVPPHLRDHFAAVYGFCRWADDLGDETGSTPEAHARAESLLAWWRQGLDACFASAQGTNPDPSVSHPVYIALRETFRAHPALPVKPFHDLIDAFIQDQHTTRYQTWDQVIDYCTRSANPVGRIVLALGGYADSPANAERFARSDATCTGLQLINFWQDVRRDLLERDRVYLPALDTGISADTLRDWLTRPDDPRARVPYIRALRPLIDRTAALFAQGRPLPRLLNPELAPVVWLFGAGGEAILSAVERIGCATLWQRPTLPGHHKAWLVARAWLSTRLTRPRRSAAAA